MNKINYTVMDIAHETNRSRHTIHHHIRRLDIGTMIGGVIFLSTEEHKQILKAIGKKKEQYDKISDALKGRR